MRRALSHTALTVVAALAALSGTPQRAGAQSLLRKIREQAAKRVEERKAQVDSAVLQTAAGAVDSTLDKTTRGASAVMDRVESVAEGAITKTERGVRSALARGDGSDELAARLATGHAVFRELRFAAGSDQLDASAAAPLSAIATALAATSGTFLIEVHTDAMDTPDAARALSERRAGVVKARLVAAGVPATRLLAVGYGATRPASDGAGGNARIELTRAQ